MTSGDKIKQKVGMGIEFVPLQVPWKRRLQTLAALIWFFPFFVLPSFGVFLLIYLLWCTSYGYLSLIYITWLVYDRNACNQGGRRINFLRGLRVWKRFSEYFPVCLVKTAELDPSKNYLFAYHPHGILSLGDIVNFGTEGTNVSEVFPGIRISWLTLKANFNVPLFRDYIMALGGCSVAKESMVHILSHRGGGHGAVVVTGGAREALYSQPNTQVVYIKDRKGFVKVAIQTGASLVPIFAFGETDVYPQVANPEGSLLRKFQNWYLSITGVSPVLPYGRGIFNYTFGFLPRRRPITTVVGAPIPVEKKLEPSQAEIDALHEQYVEALTKLYYDHREKYGDANTKITIL